MIIDCELADSAISVISTGNSNIEISSSIRDQEILDKAESMAYKFDPRFKGFTGKLSTFNPRTQNRLVVIAKCGDLAIGSAVVLLYKPSSLQNLSNSPVCVLKTISVLPDYRRKGIGGKLVNYLLKYYKQPIVCYLNCRSIEENFELSMNSLSFFKAIGGKIINNFDKHGSIKIILLPKCQ